MSRVEVRPTAKTRQRRRRRRAFTLLVYVIGVFALAWFLDSRGTTTIIFVRHADVEDPMSEAPDQPLNARGIERARMLADFLASVDVVAGPDAIYVDETTRTQQTAEPLAKKLGKPYQVADHTDVVGFMKTVLFEHNRQIVVIVTQREEMRPLIEELHGSKRIAEIGPWDYEKLFIVTSPLYGKVKTLQLSYPGPD
jgi:phosphohistidine phosphatase SixA